MVSPPEWMTDLSFLLNGELTRTGFTYRLRFPSHPLSLFCCLAYSLFLHRKVNYPVIRDFLNITWEPKIRTVLAIAEEACRQGGEGSWWEGLGRAMLDNLQEQLGSDKSERLNQVRNGVPLGFDDATVLAKIADMLLLAIVWIEDQADGPLTHLFVHSKRQDPSLFVYLLQSNRTLSLLYHPDLEKPTGSERFPYYMLVGGSVSPVVFGDVVGQSQGKDRTEQASRLAKEAERRVTESALTLIRNWYSLGVPDEVSASFHQFREDTSRYQALAAGGDSPVLGVSSLLQALSEPPIHRKQLPRQHNLSDCRTSRVPGELKTLTCGHSFHTSCLRVYINLEVRPKGIFCPLCQSYPLSQDLLISICPEYVQKVQLLKDSTISSSLSHNSSLQVQQSVNPEFICRWCKLTKRQRGTAHGCEVCLDCMQIYYFNGTVCGACKREFSDEDRLLVQATLASGS